MFAYRKDWDSLPEKCQRFGEDVEATEVARAAGATGGTTSISEMQRISVENVAEETQPLEDGA